MADSSPLYLGFDLSTQQLKGLAITSSLKVVYESKYDFDADSQGFGIKNGVLTNDAKHEVYAPVALWLRALDVLLSRLQESGLDFSRVRGISGAGQQHGSVYWSEEGQRALGEMDASKLIEENLTNGFAHPFSPNWQDASTQAECEEFDRVLGGEEELARVTGSKAHHRFTGPQILRFTRIHPAAYAKTTRISLVSSFLASLFLGKVAPIDISDACGMNLWDIKAACWHEKLIARAASSVSSPNAPQPTTTSPSVELQNKLGNVHIDPSTPLGKISPYFRARYGFSENCLIAPFTGDNPATILALPLRPNDAIVSLGTSTTFLMSTAEYAPDPSTHFFNHPTTRGLYMFMLCYKNGALARERVRDAVNRDANLVGGDGALNVNENESENANANEKGQGQETAKGKGGDKSWTPFNRLARSTPPLGQTGQTRSPSPSPMKLALYFPQPEIVPAVRAGTWRFTFSPSTGQISDTEDYGTLPASDARAIIESQLLSLRLRSRALVAPAGHNLPPQPRRVYLVGGGSQNAAIARIAGEVLGGAEGVWRLDVGGNACALGGAYRAVWVVEGASGEGEGGGSGEGKDKGEGQGKKSFETFIGARWREEDFAAKIAEGYQEGVFERYGLAVEGFERMEEEVLRREKVGEARPLPNV